ncbi:succinylglutamate desuccinylase [Aliidiomarina shirensis]|uniref:Succinylglutamate desuccinylase n=1 Tax=Aliidiomarina shirensis TaxID=1048642 RepID=A0A432WWF0_9GAMM|nr:succinylglutamate desuccinylase [Aliidiomarina shirensis]RUO38110.1 succinylglutamate desuccinylase [Aliidiomarina shirensis]
MITEFSEQNFLEFTRENEWGADIQVEQQLANGVTMQIWDSGVVVFTPATETHAFDLVLSCAVHGDETAPIEICDELIESIRSGELTLNSRVLFLIANPAAINIGKRFVEENMNRLFSGAHSKGEGLVNRERVRAKAIEGYVRQFFSTAPAGERQRLHYDMHTAIRDSKHEKFAVYPYTNGAPYKKQQLQLLQLLDVPVVLLHDGPTTTFSYFSVNEFGADAFTLELGKVKPFGENDMQRFAKTKQQLTRLLTVGPMVDGELQADALQIYKVQRSINRNHENFRLHFPDNVANFTPFNKGDVLATDGEEPVHANIDGEAVIFPNANVAIGQRALLTVMPIPAEQLPLV